MKLFRKYQQLNKLSASEFLEASPQLPFLSYIIIIIFSVLMILILWSSLATIQESSKAFGEIIPIGNIRKIQQLEGGIVYQVFVDNGQTVKQGQLLVKMDEEASKAELQKACSYELNLLLDQTRLEALIENKTPSAQEWETILNTAHCPSGASKAVIDNRIKVENSQLASQLDQQKNQKMVLELQLKQQETELKKYENQLEVSKKSISLLKQEFEMYQRLKVNNYVSHRDYLVVLRQLTDAEGDQARLVSEIQRLKKVIREYQEKIAELSSSFEANNKKELGSVNDKLLEVQHQIDKLKTTVNHTDVRAPISGIVKGVQVFAGNVVQPGGLLLEIVPDNELLIAEVQVDPRDIGFVKIGDPVIVKIMTYDYSRYGGIKGTLSEISASTFTDKNGKPFYRASVNLAQQYVTRGKEKKQLKAGMTVEADIITGKKTLMQYLLKPIQRSTSSAFTER